MRVDATDLARATGAAVPSLYRPHPRHRSAVTGVAGAGVLQTVTVNRLNEDASGTLSPPASLAELRWPRGDGKTSDWEDSGQSGQRSALGNPRTSRTGAVTASGLLEFQNTRRLSERVQVSFPEGQGAVGCCLNFARLPCPLPAVRLLWDAMSGVRNELDDAVFGAAAGNIESMVTPQFGTDAGFGFGRASWLREPGQT